MFCPRTRKHKFKSPGAAEAGLRAIKKRKPDYVGVPYWCVYCQGYHFGRLPAKPRNKYKVA